MMSRVAPLLLLLALLTFASVGCESTQDKAKRVQAENAKRQKIASMPLKVPRVDPRIKVEETVILKSKDANAVVVTLRNTSASALADIPIALYLFDSKGTQTDTNTTPGADHWLNHVPLIRAGESVSWIEDQFDAKPQDAKVTVRVGVGKPVTRPYPGASLLKTHFFQDPISGTSFVGKATSAAPVEQERLVVYSVGRQGGRIVTAGRGIVERLKANRANKSGFTIFYVGKDPRATTLANWAPPVVSPKQ